MKFVNCRRWCHESWCQWGWRLHCWHTSKFVLQQMAECTVYTVHQTLAMWTHWTDSAVVFVWKTGTAATLQWIRFMASSTTRNDVFNSVDNIRASYPRDRHLSREMSSQQNWNFFTKRTSLRKYASSAVRCANWPGICTCLWFKMEWKIVICHIRYIYTCTWSCILAEKKERFHELIWKELYGKGRYWINKDMWKVLDIKDDNLKMISDVIGM